MAWSKLTGTEPNLFEVDTMRSLSKSFADELSDRESYSLPYHIGDILKDKEHKDYDKAVDFVSKLEQNKQFGGK